MASRKEQADAVRDLVRESVAHVDRMAPEAMRAVAPVLLEARQELERDLGEWLSTVQGGDTFTNFQRARALRAIDPALDRIKQLDPAMAKGLAAGRHATAPIAARNIDREITRLGQIFGESLHVPQINTASLIARGDQLLWKRHTASARRYAGDIGDDLKRQISVGLVKGETIQQMSVRLQRLGGGLAHGTNRDGMDATAIAQAMGMRWKYAADRLTRTEVMHAYNVQHDIGLQEVNAERPPGEDEWLRRWDAAADRAVCSDCQALDRTVAPIGGTFRGYAAPPLHPHCFLPGTRVGARVVAAMRSNYAGDAVEIQTATGRTLRVTANHPVATTRGFVAASTLRKWDQVLGQRGEIWRDRADAGSVRTEPRCSHVDEDHKPPAIDEIYGALAMQGPTFRTTTTDDDLHGDARGGNGYVDVVTMDGELQHAADRGGDLTLPFSEVNHAIHARAGAGDLHGGGSRCSAHSIVSGDDLFSPGIGAHAGPFHRLTLGLPAQGNAAAREPTTEDASIDPGLVGNLLEAFPSDVFLDDVIEVRHFAYSGHVYDLQTVTGWIVSEGIYTSNCRCVLIAWLARWGDIKGEVQTKGDEREQHDYKPHPISERAKPAEEPLPPDTVAMTREEFAARNPNTAGNLDRRPYRTVYTAGAGGSALDSGEQGMQHSAHATEAAARRTAAQINNNPKEFGGHRVAVVKFPGESTVIEGAAAERSAALAEQRLQAKAAAALRRVERDAARVQAATTRAAEAQARAAAKAAAPPKVKAVDPEVAARRAARAERAAERARKAEEIAARREMRAQREAMRAPKNPKRVAAAKIAGEAAAERKREIHSAIRSNLSPDLHVAWDKEGHKFMQQEAARIRGMEDRINAASKISEAFTETYGGGEATAFGNEGDRHHKRVELEAEHAEHWADEQERKGWEAMRLAAIDAGEIGAGSEAAAEYVDEELDDWGTPIRRSTTNHVAAKTSDEDPPF